MRTLLLLLSVTFLPAAAGAEIIDRIAATVDREVITLSELNQVMAVRLIGRNAGEGEDAYRRRVLDTLIAQALRYRDVLRFGAEDVPADAVEARVLDIVRRFGSQEEFVAALARAELTEDELRALAKRQLQVEAYIEERFSPLIFVSLEEIETYYEQTWRVQRVQRGLAVQPLSEVREEIRSILKAERLQTEIDRWTTQLRARANVDVFVYR